MNFANFFSNIQESPWYRDFLNPVIHEISNGSKILDIGTGTGKMIQILAQEKNVKVTGVDTNRTMIAEAKIKLKDTNALVIEILPNEVLPFEEEHFDFITICSVLFHLDNDGIDFVLGESRRLLKPGGKIIIHTPTGQGSLGRLTQKYFSLKNMSIYIWYLATKNKAKQWTSKNYLRRYSLKNKLPYHTEIVMNGFAQIETINK